MESLKPSGIDIINEDFSNHIMPSVRFNKRLIKDTSFHNSIMNSMIFASCRFENVKFTGAKITNCVFNLCKFYNCDFNNCAIINSTIFMSEMYDTTIEYARIESTSKEWRFNTIYKTEFENVKFTDTKFKNTSLATSIFKNCTGLPPIVCPEEGSFIGWKKAYSNDKEYLIKLEIPEDAKRSSGTTNKCRCSKAKVLEIFDLSDDEFSKCDSIVNDSYIKLLYRTGEMVYPDSFDNNRWHECSHGIHFFMTREEAVEYVI